MKTKTVTPLISVSLPFYHFQVDYMDENEEYFQRQASHRQSRRRFRKINQKGERQTIIDTVDPYPTGKPPIARGYHTVSCILRYSFVVVYPRCGRSLRAPEAVSALLYLCVMLCLCVELLLPNLLCFCFGYYLKISVFTLFGALC